MTMHTAYSSRVTASALPENPKPKPSMTFAEYAERESRAALFDVKGNRGPLANCEILDAIEANPGITVTALTDFLRRNRDTVANRVKGLVASGKLRSEQITVSTGHKHTGYFTT